jgi:hypothetical protein
MAGRRETDDLKPIDKATERVVSESPGRNESEREVAPRESHSGGRALTQRAKAAWDAEIWPTQAAHSGGVVSGGTAARTCQATGEALLAPGRNVRRKVGSITGDHREMSRRREGGGWGCSSEEGG